MPEFFCMLPDAQIVQQVLAGDAEAFALLVDRHHARCLRAATHLLGDADEAEDTVQDAFVRAYRHLRSYREQDRFGGWQAQLGPEQREAIAQLRVSSVHAASVLGEFNAWKRGATPLEAVGNDRWRTRVLVPRDAVHTSLNVAYLINNTQLIPAVAGSARSWGSPESFRMPRD